MYKVSLTVKTVYSKVICSDVSRVAPIPFHQYLLSHEREEFLNTPGMGTVTLIHLRD